MDLAYDISTMSPLIFLSISAIMLLCVDVLSKKKRSQAVLATVSLLGALVLLELSFPFYATGRSVFSGLLFADTYTLFFFALLILGSLFAVILSAPKLAQEGIESNAEYYALMLMSTVGAMVFVAAREMITLFVGLEIMSMALYCLCGAALNDRRSSESAMKYFLLGSFSSAFMLYGMALLYGLTGSTMLNEMVPMINQRGDNLLVHLALGLVMIGFIFKIGAVPFHFWAPDVYQGAPTSVTAYMACVIKAAAVGAALRMLWVGFPQLLEYWSGAIWTIAFLTMVFGNLLALAQRSVKRMLAYSSVAHAGYMLVAFIVPGQSDFGGGAALLYYLVAYSLMTLGAFGVVLALTAVHSASNHPDDIVRFNGLGYRKPLLGFLMAIFMFSLAGLPPGFAGLVGKFYIFSAAIKAEYVGLAIVGVLCSAVSCFYYLRVIVAMYFVEAGQEKTVEVELPMRAVLSLCAIGLIIIGIFPWTLHDGFVRIVSQMQGF